MAKAKKKTPEQIAAEKEEKEVIKQEKKLIKDGYGPFNQASNTCGSESTAKYIASKYEDAVITYHPADKLWGKSWKVWVKQ